jgi:GNAT superfamily N-acetyltransferase
MPTGPMSWRPTTARSDLAGGTEPPQHPGEHASHTRDPRVLSAAAAPAVVGVLCEAFRDYPVMRYVLGDREDYEVRIQTLIGFFVQARVLRGEPMLGLVEEGEVAAAAVVSHPDGPASPPELKTLRERVWAELGLEEQRRYEEFSAAVQPLLVTAPHIHLNMLGVRQRRQGRGLGRILLKRVHHLSAERPGSTGVTLTTELEGNLPFYQAAGYRITGHVRIAPDLTTWAFFRPNQSPS